MQINSKLKGKKFLLDTSALIALLKKESGYEVIENVIASNAISSVNLSELVAVLTRSGVSEQDIDEIISDLVPEIVPFCEAISIKTGKLAKLTQNYGLSLGDRACIALGITLGLPIYTADKVCAELKLENTDIRLIR
ncbi:type II toxin-antitoxin system VapC family toxin (plasmid) [Candidatus Megaera polyxenophila]|uniref:type II toxin-antitoxin system VapC family toxin n=1 Tax=Candidatus Megaera polyxenophila TaxID=988779 RepID=UPI00249EEC74|nr:type II toxin-antitoxin system VapC family toxin [Candidatus Megaera polyxenophila]